MHKKMEKDQPLKKKTPNLNKSSHGVNTKVSSNQVKGGTKSTLLLI
jgi:hypothetical protein